MPADTNIGAFEDKLELYTLTQTRGSEGEKIESFSLMATVYGNVSVSTTESVESDNQAAKMSATITIYKRTDITTRWQIKWGSVVFEITSIVPDERLSPFMQISVREA